MQSHHSSKNIDETWAVASDLIKKTDHHIFFLYGDLGSGKTTFTQGIGKAVGISHHLQSPTFIIMRSYELNDSRWSMLYHVDLYRIESIHEIEELGVIDLMSDPKNLFVIEWPEKLAPFFPPKRTDIHFTYQDENVREIEIKEII